MCIRDRFISKENKYPVQAPINKDGANVPPNPPELRVIGTNINFNASNIITTCHDIDNFKMLLIPTYPTPKISVKKYPLTPCLLYTSDAADERSSVDLGGRRIIKKQKRKQKKKKKQQERTKNIYTMYKERHNITGDRIRTEKTL